MNPVGQLSLLSATDEKMVADLVDNVAEWGFLLGPFEVKMMVKDLLDSRGEKSRCPDNDWFSSFSKRNKMSMRATTNIKRLKAEVDADDTRRLLRQQVET